MPCGALPDFVSILVSPKNAPVLNMELNISSLYNFEEYIVSP